MGYVPVDVNSAVRKECLRRGYSVRTIETYQNCIKKFLEFSGKKIDTIGKGDALEFLNHLKEKRASGSTLNVYLCLLDF
ncbi:MAG: phage integrase N-terminal SAM-like domain-containing protein [Nanoarchaeota archaeon]